MKTQPGGAPHAQGSKERCAALQRTVSRSQSQASSLKATVQALFQVCCRCLSLTKSTRPQLAYFQVRLLMQICKYYAMGMLQHLNSMKSIPAMT